MIFIDHNSKTVWNGSRLGKDFSANVFNDYWNDNSKPDTKATIEPHPGISQPNDTGDLPSEKLHQFFDFLNTEPLSDKHENGFIEALGGLLPETQGENYEEAEFANRMKKKKKRKRS